MSEPIHIISLGAGVQSSTMALMAAAGEITPMPKCCIFADTQAEPASVYKWLDFLEKQLPFPVYRVTAGNLREKSLQIGTKDNGDTWVKGGIPAFALKPNGEVGPLFRKCTYDFKIVPIQKRIAEWRDVGVVQWIGISVDEIGRIKESQVKWVENRWPLVDLRKSRVDCLNWMDAKGFPKPPRSACSFCPFHSDAEWRRLKTEEPIAFYDAVDYEREMQSLDQFRNGSDTKLFLHRSCKPLSEIDFSTEEERGQLNMFNNECEGMCGV